MSEIRKINRLDILRINQMVNSTIIDIIKSSFIKQL